MKVIKSENGKKKGGQAAKSRRKKGIKHVSIKESRKESVSRIKSEA